MRTHSNNFVSSLDGIRQLSGYISYTKDLESYILTTESSHELTTELQELIEIDSRSYRVKEEMISRIDINTEAELLKGVCPTVSIISKETIPKDTYINVKIGVKVNDAYEYIDYGKFLILDEPEYEASSKTYNIVAYNDIIRSNVKYEEDITFPITYNNLLQAIATKFGWECNLNISDTTIEKDIYANQNLTYRTILDDLNKIAFGCFIVEDGKLILKTPTQTNQTITEEEIKDSNCEIKEQLSNINYLSITHNTNVEIDKRETTGEEKVEFNINDCYLLNAYSTEFSNEIDALFTNLQTISYYFYDMQTTGLLIYEPLDLVTLNIENTNYNTIILNSEIIVDTGLEESIRADNTKIVDKYTHVTQQENKNNNALISIDKANAQIILKVDSDGKIVSARLDANADDGTLFEVKADNIKLEGYTTINGNFKIDTNGNMECSNAKVNGQITSANGSIGGWNIDSNGLFNSYGYYLKKASRVIQGIQCNYGITNSYTIADLIICQAIILGMLPTPDPASGVFEHYDPSGDGVINSLDLLIISQIINSTY